MPAEEIEYDARGLPFVRTWGFPERGGWVKTPRDLLRDATLDSHSKIIYLLIVDECQRTQQTTVEYPYRRLMYETGIGSHHTVADKLGLLQERGFLTIEGDPGRASDNTRRYYTPTDPDEAEYAHRVTDAYARRAQWLARSQGNDIEETSALLTGPKATTASPSGNASREPSTGVPSKEEDERPI